jgi:hypothetical protein
MSSFRSRFLIILVLAAVAMTGPWSVSPAVSAISSISADTELVNPAQGPLSGEPDVGQTAPNASRGAYDEDMGGLVDWLRTAMMIWTVRWTGMGF